MADFQAFKTIKIDPKDIKLTFNNIEIKGFLEPDPYYDCKAEAKALLNLWQEALDSVEVRYPNPQVRVNKGLHIHSTAMCTLQLSFLLDNLPDTTDPSKVHHSFLHYSMISEWPGMRMARAYISSVWAIYLQHEAFELVTLKDRRSCSPHHPYTSGCRGCQRVNMPIDAHAGPHESHHQHMVAYEIHQVNKMIEWTLGAQGLKMLEVDHPRAFQDLTNEVAYVKRPWNDSGV